MEILVCGIQAGEGKIVNLFLQCIDLIVRVAGCDYSHSFDKLFTLHTRWKKKMVYWKPHHDVAPEHSLESIPRNRFLGSLNVYKYGPGNNSFFQHEELIDLFLSRRRRKISKLSELKLIV